MANPIQSKSARDYLNNETQNNRWHERPTADPTDISTPNSAQVGRHWFRDDLLRLRYHDGTLVTHVPRIDTGKTETVAAHWTFDRGAATPPFSAAATLPSVGSTTTMVANLNADYLHGYLPNSTNVGNTIGLRLSDGRMKGEDPIDADDFATKQFVDDLGVFPPGMAGHLAVWAATAPYLRAVATLTDFIAGTTNQVIVTNDGDGTVTLSLPQNIHTGASPIWVNLRLTGLTQRTPVISNDLTGLFQIANPAAKRLYGWNSVSTAMEFIIVGTGLTYNEATSTLTAAGLGGTVTSVAATAPAAGFTIAGSPITTSGTFVFALADDLAAVEALSTTGFVRRTALNTWSTATLIPLASGGLEVSLSDPGGHRLLGWDDTDNLVRWITIGNGLTYTAATDTISVSLSGIVGSTDTQVIFNDGGTAFGGDAGLTYLKTTDALRVGGYIAVNATPSVSYRILVTETVADTHNTVRINHTASTGATSHARLLLDTVDGGGDAYINFGTSSTDFSMGIDNSVSGNPFVIAASGTLGTTNLLSMTTAGVITLTSPLPIGSGGTGKALTDPGGHRLLGWDDTDNDIRFFTIGTNLSYDAATDTLNAAGTGGGGTVTSVSTVAPAAGFTITGSPITISGTFTFALSDDLAAVEGISTTGIVQRTASNTWSTTATVPIGSGGTGSALTDPGADRLLGWDDTNNDIRFFIIGSGLSYNAATDTLTASGAALTAGNGIVISGSVIHFASSSNYTAGAIFYANSTTTVGQSAALSGIVQGNGTSAPTAITGTAGRLAQWAATAPYLIDSIIGISGQTITINGGNSTITSSGLLTITATGATGHITLTPGGAGAVIVSYMAGPAVVFAGATGGLSTTGTVDAIQGGTGISSYTVGDILYANSTTTLAKLADVATGQVLHSGGVGVAPAYSAVHLVNDTTSILPLSKGGTGFNLSAPTAHKLLGWDNTDADVRFFTIGTGLSYDAATDTISATGTGGTVTGSGTINTHAKWTASTVLGNSLISESGSLVTTTGTTYITGNPTGACVIGFPSGATSTDWRLVHSTGVFAGINDPAFAIGYNPAFVGGFGCQNLAESAAYYAIEACYRVDLGNGLGSVDYMEMYHEVVGTGGVGVVRPFMTNVLKSDPKTWSTSFAAIAGAGSQFAVSDWTGAPDNIFIVYKNSAAVYMKGYLGIGVQPSTNYRLNVEETVAGTSAVIRLDHTATSGASNAKFLIQTASGGGDPFINFVAGASEFSFGQDNSVSGDPMKLSASGALGTTDVLTIPTTGDATLLGSLTVLGNPDATGHLLFGAPTGIASTNWRMAHFQGSFLGIDNPTLVLGYNVSNNAGVDNAGQPLNYIAFESRYRTDLGNGLGAVDYMEWYQSMIGTGGNSIRPFATIALRSNPHSHTTTNVSIAGAFGGFNIVNETGSAVFTVFNNGPATLIYGYAGINVAPSISYRLNIQETVAGTPASMRIGHTATSGVSDARFVMQTASGGGDPFINFVSGAAEFSMGVDNSDSDKFKISAGGALGTTDRFTMTTAGVITLAVPLGLGQGGTGSALSDPGAHRVLGWDDTDNDVRFMVIGNGLTYNDATDTLSVSISGIIGSTDTQVIFNDGGTSFGGDAGLTYAKTTDALRIGGYLAINATPSVSYRVYVSESVANADNTIRFSQTAVTGATSHARVLLDTAAGGGDPFLNVKAGATDWSLGIDNSESGDPFVIAASGGLGTSNVLTITTAGVINLPTMTAARFLRVNSSKDIVVSSASTITLATETNGILTLAQGGTSSSLGIPTAHQLLGWDNTDGDVRFFVIGSGLTYTPATDTLSATGLGGTVTSVAATPPAAGFTISGSPITGSGTFVFALSDDLAAVEALATTGIVQRTATNTWSTVALGTANQVLGVNAAGTASEYKTLTQTANQVLIAHGVGAVTFSLPQDIATSSSPQFASVLASSASTPGFAAVVTTEATNSVVVLGNAGFASRLELVYVGTSSSALYGIPLGGVGINASSTSLTLSTSGTARMVISSAGLINLPGLTASRFLRVNSSKDIVVSTASTISLTTETNGILTLAQGGTSSSLGIPSAHMVLGWDNTDGDVRFFAIGAGLSYNPATDTLSATGGAGTVTSVDLTMPSVFTVGGNPVTTSGTLAVTLVTQAANLVWAGPASGSAATPTFRALVALDLPAHVHSAADITSGTMATARLGSGTADSTTFLRGDQTWAVPSGGSGSLAIGDPVTGGGPSRLLYEDSAENLAATANMVWDVAAGNQLRLTDAYLHVLNTTGGGNSNGIDVFISATGGTSNIGIFSAVTGATDNYSLYLDDGDMRMGKGTSKLGFFGIPPVVRASTYTPTNVTTDRAYDANTVAIAELADVVGTLIADLQAYGLLA